MNNRPLYAVIPAAGLSRRMGRPKLLLPLEGKTVISRLLAALDHPQICCRAVVLRRDDKDLKREVHHAGGWPIRPEVDPPEMRESVEYALQAIEEKFSPSDEAGWMLVPADHPVLDSAVIGRLIEAWNRHTADIFVPTFESRRGHPAFFSWRLAKEVPLIPKDRGLNWLSQTEVERVLECPMDDPAVLTDLDSPEDFEILKLSFRGNS